MSVDELYTYLCKSMSDVVDERTAPELLRTIEEWIIKHGYASLLHNSKKRRITAISDTHEPQCDLDGTCSL